MLLSIEMLNHLEDVLQYTEVVHKFVPALHQQTCEAKLALRNKAAQK